MAAQNQMSFFSGALNAWLDELNEAANPHNAMSTTATPAYSPEPE